MGASNNSTHRDLSRFALVENVDTGCCCGHCVVRGVGHNSKICPECSKDQSLKSQPSKEHWMQILFL